MLTPQQVDSWAVVFPSRLQPQVDHFVLVLKEAAARMELRLPQPYNREINDYHTSSYLEALKNVVVTCNPKMILVVIPNNNPDRYRYVKIMKSCDL
jgi:hypothetical protein